MKPRKCMNSRLNIKFRSANLPAPSTSSLTYHDYHWPTMLLTDSKQFVKTSGGFSSLWLPSLLVICIAAILYAFGHVKGGLVDYKTFIVSAQWFDNELLTARIPLSEICSTSAQGLQICLFPSKSTLFSDTPKNIWIDWETLRSRSTPCKEPCIINEVLPPFQFYDTPIELANAYCTLPSCMIASSGQIRIQGSVSSVGNITVLARSDIIIGSVTNGKSAGALIVSSQGTVRVLKPDIESAATILHAFPADPSTPGPLTEDFTSPITIIEGVRAVRKIE